MAFLARPLFLFCVGTAAAAPVDIFLSLSQGYTHYRAQDLNRVLVLLEKTTQQQGFNDYGVDQFDGHPQNALILGLQWGRWRLGVESEFWVEDFAQHEVPFDLENAEREYRISCADLRGNPGTPGLYGCVEARERFTFLPVTLQASRNFRLSRSVSISPGYGLGFLAGSAHVELSTQYYGLGAAAPDQIGFDAWVGVNPVHKIFADLEWKPFRRVGIEGRAGWRYTYFPWAELRGRQGASRVFGIVFPDAENGARLYIQRMPRPEDDQIYLGTPQGAGRLAQSTGTRLHLAAGDFTGWFLAVKANFYWRGLG